MADPAVEQLAREATVRISEPVRVDGEAERLQREHELDETRTARLKARVISSESCGVRSSAAFAASMADSAVFFLGASGSDAGFELVENAAGDVAGIGRGGPRPRTPPPATF